jgi:hypothetical protein
MVRAESFPAASFALTRRWTSRGESLAREIRPSAGSRCFSTRNLQNARDRTLEEVEALLEVSARVYGHGAGHPEVVKRMLGGFPAPPTGHGVRGSPALEIGVPHGAVRQDRGAHLAEDSGVASQPVRLAGVAQAIVEHRAGQ